MNKILSVSAWIAALAVSTQSPSAQQAPAKAADLSKRVVEAPIKHGNWLRPNAPGDRRVAPGLVAWHTDLDAAKAASARTGKPVLLFQLLGNLDDEFC